MKRMNLLLSVVILAAIANSATASVVVHKPPDATRLGVNSNEGLTFQRIADDFSLDSTVRIGSVSWYGHFTDNTTLTADFDIVFLEADGSTGLPASPGTTLSLTSLTGVDTTLDSPVPGGDIIEWTWNIAGGLELAAGDWWISVQGNEGTLRWIWSLSDPDPTGGPVFQDVGSTVWEEVEDTRNSQAFTLALVPVPAALPLFLSAVAGMGFVGWRRRRRLV